jgi:hypothetical protein
MQFFVNTLIYLSFFMNACDIYHNTLQYARRGGDAGSSVQCFAVDKSTERGRRGGRSMVQGWLAVGQCARRGSFADGRMLALALCWSVVGVAGRWLALLVGGCWSLVAGRWSLVYTIVDVIINIPAPLSGGGAVGRFISSLVRLIPLPLNF